MTNQPTTTMAIDPARPAIRQALLQKLVMRAMTTKERTELKPRDRTRQESESEAPAAEAKAEPDAGNGESAAT